eukprot:SAG31_NODE_3803_length_3868_cov_6.379146_1_plen_57_part_00
MYDLSFARFDEAGHAAATGARRRRACRGDGGGPGLLWAFAGPSGDPWPMFSGGAAN